jgi:Tol biopolymer transport system component/DNA-binding winged helix-turn-helix (wHTH) protein
MAYRCRGSAADKERQVVTSDGFRLGPWLVHPKLNRISGESGDEQIEPRLMRVLELLAESAGEVVTRDELLTKVWGDVVVGEETVTVTISQLRRLLGDDARQPRYIETIRKGGYRLVAAVEPLTGPQPPIAPPVMAAGGKRWRRLLVAAVVGIGIMVGSGVVWLILRQSSGAQQPQLLSAVPLTSDSGSERFPALAPDGVRVAYCRHGDIFVTQQGAARALQLTDHPESELYPTWSPDSRQVAFVRHGSQEATIMTVSSMGGVARELVRVEPLVAGLDWSPDGRWLAVSASNDPEQPYLIALVDATTGELRQLTRPQPEFACDSWPRFSPDATRVAFVRAGWGVQHELFVVSTAGGAERRVAERQGFIRGLDWLDSDSLVLATVTSGMPHLVRIDLVSGAVVQLPLSAVESAAFPSYASGSLVFEQARLDRDIWEVALSDERPARCLIDSTRIDEDAVVSPDDQVIAFVSQRTGQRNLWLCARDGSEPRPLTSFSEGQVLQPGWSPDSARIAFTAAVDGPSAVWVVERSGGPPQQLPDTGVPVAEVFSIWSADGEWLYFGREQAERWQLWRMHSDGSGRELVAVDGLAAVVDSGAALVYLSPGPSLCRLDHGDGSRETLAGADLIGSWLMSAANAHGLLAMTVVDQELRLQRLDLSNGQLDDLGPMPFAGGFSVAPDGRSILVERDDRSEHDLMLVRMRK